VQNAHTQKNSKKAAETHHTGVSGALLWRASVNALHFA
jgi:hypothetical protein